MFRQRYAAGDLADKSSAGGRLKGRAAPCGHEPDRGRTKFVPKPGSHSADDPDFGYNQAHKWGSGDGLEKHKCRCQIQDQHSNHNEDHVVAVILSHFCVLRMIDAPGSQQFAFHFPGALGAGSGRPGLMDGQFDPECRTDAHLAVYADLATMTLDDSVRK